jgi:hypothetical protein
MVLEAEAAEAAEAGAAPTTSEPEPAALEGKGLAQPTKQQPTMSDTKARGRRALCEAVFDLIHSLLIGSPWP